LFAARFGSEDLDFSGGDDKEGRRRIPGPEVEADVDAVVENGTFPE